MDAWNNFKKYFFRHEGLGLSIDFSQVGFDDVFFDTMSDKISLAFREMAALEAGAIANKDENRMVGHYWLRNSVIAPTEDLQKIIDFEVEKLLKFVDHVHMGHVAGQAGKFEHALFIGIGGSSLGPQLICDSLRGSDKIQCHFIDNTDPDGIDLILHDLAGELGKTLVVVTSKSGTTPEPRNAMLEVRAVYEAQGYLFSRHAVAVTGGGSLLDRQAAQERWLERFAMWDWVGGRTSVFSCVGLLPAALQGRSIKNFMSGARDMDAITRIPSDKNPAMLMALAWYLSGDGYGKKDMVVLPYKDRLSNFAKYLQQLIMESLGKLEDRAGNVVRQGLTVYGNKGSTDQHAFIQQLRDGLDNFFITVINVLRACDRRSVVVDEDGMTSEDYLNGFSLGTMQALKENNVPIIHMSVDKFSERELGILIALYERVVGFYASMIDVNAYNQPGVEAGKKAAEKILKIQKSIVKFLNDHNQQTFSLMEISSGLGLDGDGDIVLIFKILSHLTENEKIRKVDGTTPFDALYGVNGTKYKH